MSEDEADRDGPLGGLWQRSEVRFGLRAAALAGLVVTVGPATVVELSGVLDGQAMAGTLHITCSGHTN